MNTPVACTATAESGLPSALVLARSYLAHHPGHRFTIAVLDGEDGGRRGADGVTLVGPDLIGPSGDEFLGLATAHPLPQLVDAVKPWLLREQLRNASRVTWFSPTSFVTAPIGEQRGTVVAPHLLRPLTGEAAESAEARLIGTGVLNPGYLSTDDESLLDAWVEAVAAFRAVRFDRDALSDQDWFDQALSLVPHEVSADPGLVLTAWNAFERPGVEPKVVDLLGFEPRAPWVLSSLLLDRPAALLSERPDLVPLVREYADLLIGAGHLDEEEVLPTWLDELPDGTPLTPLLRGTYRAAVLASTDPRRAKRPAAPPHAFTGAEFRDWLNGPGELGGTTRFTQAVWESRPDLQAVFGRPAHPGFAHWCRESAPAEGVLPEWAVPAPTDPPTPPQDRLGVNLLGHLTAVLGVGELGRVLNSALSRSGLDVAPVVEEAMVVNRTDVDRPEESAPVYPVSVLCVNADLVRAVSEQHPQVVHERYRIGVWSWELEEFPEAMHEFDCVDEVWTISEYCRAAIAPHTDKPVRVFPIPIRERPAVESRAGGPVRFLFAMDFNSLVERKNPFGAIEAFRRAFPGREDVELVVKVINGERHVAGLERLRSAAAGDPRVTLLERYLTAEELHDLYAGSDCYVSLHRAEGFGFTVAEAMAMGLPVITTDYSGTAEFVDRENCWLVPAEPVPVGPGSPPYPADALWADPDLDVAATAMREVADDPARAAERGLAAREHLRRTRGEDAAAAWVRDRVEQAHRTWRERRAPAQAQAAPEAKPQLVVPLLRKVAVRALGRYDSARHRGR